MLSTLAGPSRLREELLSFRLETLHAFVKPVLVLEKESHMVAQANL